jgi:dimethylargininase
VKAIVRRPGPRLGDGIVTHVERRSVDVELAFAQWDAYVDTLRIAGWETIEAPSADEFPDGVFIEDALVVHGELAVVTRPGAEARLGETAGLDEFAAELGFRVVRISPPGALDGGDVLRVGDGYRVGIGGRTNAEGAAQLAEATGMPVSQVPVRDGVLHLKTALAALPGGELIEANVVDLGRGQVLVAKSAPGIAEQIAARGLEPLAVDISEFEKLEAGVSCLSVLARSTI